VVRSTLRAALGLWANPLIDAATSASDFSLADLRRTPTTIYVAVSLDQLPSLARLLNLFFQQAIALLAQCRPGADEPHPVLFLLDEFASLAAEPPIAPHSTSAALSEPSAGGVFEER
jgi:type IV secretion system protein VirD4